MITFDIHSNHETVNDAIYQLDQAIKLARKSKERLICLITGYGSKKTSHKIKTNIEEILMEYKSKNKIKDFILGASLDMFNPIYLGFKYKDLIPESEKKLCNPGAIYVVI